jgi:hypothetical protein
VGVRIRAIILDKKDWSSRLKAKGIVISIRESGNGKGPVAADVPIKASN